MPHTVAFIDLEVSENSGRILDAGVIKNEVPLHSNDMRKVASFLKGSEFLCGHNILDHDIKYLSGVIDPGDFSLIDTLYLSPLLFPRKPYHALLKDDKLQSEQLNNPVNDCQKCQLLFYDELNAFRALPREERQILCCLLSETKEFKGFFSYLNYRRFPTDLSALIKKTYEGMICANADIDWIIRKYPVELAYALALIRAGDASSVTPPWVLHRMPVVENVIDYLCGTPCSDGCAYCLSRLDIHKSLRKIFGFEEFRTYEGEPLQERAVRAAVGGESLLAIFPTGGGKSITFQLPALMSYDAVHGLTVVISPLQSLMKDQVDNLMEKGITSAVTVNGLLNPIERKETLERVSDGSASILYISPESLRSRTIQRALFGRNVVRFVIDEAHCFSAWGQDFRVDYQYIGDFIREYQQLKNPKKPVAVSCFTATAKQKVISDIRDYFKRKLDIDLELYASSASRTNLRYAVQFVETEEAKYSLLRNLIAQRSVPTIVYVSTVRRSEELAGHLREDGFAAEAYNGRMSSDEKIRIQDSFINNETDIIVATSAFGMGVDKSDVRLVVHYEISPSLENYLQEAGRAGRDPSLEAECIVLFNNDDLDDHFMMLNQAKLSISEIQQVWKAIKDNTQNIGRLCISPLELARAAGWENSSFDPETKVKAAILALETAGYVKRGDNVPHIYATGINVPSMADAANVITDSDLLTEQQKIDARRIMSKLISSRSVAQAGSDDAESRIDYLADILGISREDIIREIQILREIGLLSDSQDMAAYIDVSDTGNSAVRTLGRFSRLESFLLSELQEEVSNVSLKEINQYAQDADIVSSVRNIRTVINFLAVRKYISKDDDRGSDRTRVTLLHSTEVIKKRSERRREIARACIAYLFDTAKKRTDDRLAVEFSFKGVHDACRASVGEDVKAEDVEEALLYLSRIGALKLEGGFLVLYNALQIDRLVMDNRIKFKVDDYRTLDEYYKQKIQQIHIVGEYANLMVKDYDKALKYVQDYFQMDYQQFISTYFKDRKEAAALERNITSRKYDQLFGELSESQTRIIDDDKSQYIVVLAGPGSGKTKVLVHKLASLLLMEDIKSDQLLMLTFSRAAATEFKSRLRALIGSPARYVDIKTFHSYSFDLLGKIGSLEESDDVVGDAAGMIESGEVESGKIAKSVLVIDEAQDMGEQDFRLVQALMNANEEMRVIAVGDDDQNIFGFRGSDSGYMARLQKEKNATVYEMTENYRSAPNIVRLSNEFAKTIGSRLKKTDIIPVKKEDGDIRILRHHGKNIETAVVNVLYENQKKEKTCVLTYTNEEALLIVGMLKQRNIRARLIQSSDEFDLGNLAEIRYFLKCIDDRSDEPLISNEVWQEAKSRLKTAYADSSCLVNCLNLIEQFEENYDKYRSDLSLLIKESSFSDFYYENSREVYVSTIHKAKGREFDSVHLLLKNRSCVSDEDKRTVYVALTRAKQNLYIHCDRDLFRDFSRDGLIYDESDMDYPEASEVTLQLGHRGVVLDYFLSRKETILKLHSGKELSYSDGYLTAELEGRTVTVAKLSKAALETIDSYRRKGYEAAHGQVRFIVAWKREDDENEYAVLLPELTLRKEK